MLPYAEGEGGDQVSCSDYRRIANLEDEITSLKTLVGNLADGLSGLAYEGCEYKFSKEGLHKAVCPSCRYSEDCFGRKAFELIARARAVGKHPCLGGVDEESITKQNKEQKMTEVGDKNVDVSCSTGFGIGLAIEMLKSGSHVRRVAWHDKTKYLWLKHGTMVKSEWCKDHALKAVADANGGEIEGSPVICMFLTKDGKPYILTGWHPTPCDLLADDWIIFKANGEELGQ